MEERYDYELYLDCYRKTYDAKVVPAGGEPPEWASEYTEVCAFHAPDWRTAVLRGMEIADERWRQVHRER